MNNNRETIWPYRYLVQCYLQGLIDIPVLLQYNIIFIASMLPLLQYRLHASRTILRWPIGTGTSARHVYVLE